MSFSFFSATQQTSLSKITWPFTLLLLDIFAIHTAILINQIITIEDYAAPRVYRDLFLAFRSTLPFLALLVPSLAYQGLYTKRTPLWDEIRRIAKVVLLVILIVLIILFMQLGHFKTPLMISLAQFGVLTIFFLVFYRICGKKFFFRFGFGQERAMILGAGSAGISILRGLRNDRYIGYDIIGFLDDDLEKEGTYVDSVKVFGPIRNLPEFIRLYAFDTVIIAIPSLPSKDLSVLTNKIQQSAKKIMFVPDLQGIALFNTEIRHILSQRLFLIQINNNLRSAINIAIKRACDIVLSLALMPLLVPLIAVIGALIKLESRGPIFYAHARIGKNGNPLQIYKFRSMFNDADERLTELLTNSSDAQQEWESYFKLKDDPRITKVGRFLRKTSLDELPQIFNVLKGEMSLVGPRPVVQAEIEKYYKEYAEYYFMIRPGITGLWQVSGRSMMGYDARVNLDTWYVMNWSLWLDIVILFKTVRVVLKREGAY